jgi:hypothetical protein
MLIRLVGLSEPVAGSFLFVNQRKTNVNGQEFAAAHAGQFAFTSAVTGAAQASSSASGR